MARKASNPREAFASRYQVDPVSECWNWTGTFAKGGYGQWQYSKTPLGGGKYQRHRVYAHRLSWELNEGAIPEGMVVCHRCDNPGCVNPAHLFLGTMADNQRDMARKGRSPRGERQGKSKLTEADVRAILASSEPHAIVGRRYGVTVGTVSDIRRKITWSHLHEQRNDVPWNGSGTRLVQGDIPVIRSLHESGYTAANISRRFGVSDTLIRAVVNGKIWKHVK